MRQINETLRRPSDALDSERESDVGEVDRCLSALAADQHPEVLPNLLRLLSDAKPDEAMFSIVHFVEHSDDLIYSRALASQVCFLWTRAPGWAQILHVRILNSTSTSTVYFEHVATLSEQVRECVRAVLDSVATAHPKLANQAKAASQSLLEKQAE